MDDVETEKKAGMELTSVTHLTHQTVITRLLANAMHFTNLVERDAVATEQAAMYDKIALPAVRRENSWL